MRYTFDHFNIDVADLERSLKFYKEALLLEKVGEIKRDTYTINYLGFPGQHFRLELTFLHDHTHPYELGENESHLAFRVDDFEGALRHHKEMGVVCFENPDVGIYFIEDPDGYWIEILPPNK